jgi:hypothetical protein
MYCRGIRASRGRQRAEDKERLRERVLVDGKGDNFLSGGGWAAPLYIHATVDAKTMWFHHSTQGRFGRYCIRIGYRAVQPALG